MTLQRTSRATLDVPSHEIDLGRWIYELSDADYQACARGHRAAGSFSDEHGRGTITVEPIGGHMIISSAERWAPCLRRVDMYTPQLAGCTTCISYQCERP